MSDSDSDYESHDEGCECADCEECEYSGSDSECTEDCFSEISEEETEALTLTLIRTMTTDGGKERAGATCAATGPMLH